MFMESNNMREGGHDYTFIIGNNYNVKSEYYHYSKYWLERKVRLIINGTCWGELTITGHPFNYSLGKMVNTVSIRVDRPYQKLGFSRVLIKSMINLIYKMEPDVKPTHKLYIEPDLAFGFWNYLGVNAETVTDTVTDTVTEGFQRFDYYTTIGQLSHNI